MAAIPVPQNFQVVDPNDLTLPDPNTTNDEYITAYGLIDFKIKVDKPGATAKVIVYLPKNLPYAYPGYQWYWFKYRDENWYDYSENVVFNTTENYVILTLVDGSKKKQSSCKRRSG